MAEKIKKGAGIFFICTEDNTALLIRRSQSISEPGTWGIPGGNLEKGETYSQGALRESLEEVGSVPRGRVVEMLENAGEGWKYMIFVTDIPWNQKKIWTAKIKLNKENDAIKWFRISELPDNLHSAITVIKT